MPVPFTLGFFQGTGDTPPVYSLIQLEGHLEAWAGRVQQVGLPD